MTTALPSRSKRVLWSPDGRDLFLVGSADLRLYEWKPAVVKSHPPALSLSQHHHPSTEAIPSSIQMVALNASVPLMKCFAWAPHPTWDDLVAVGQTNGRATILRLRQQQNILVHSTPAGSQTDLSRIPPPMRTATTSATTVERSMDTLVNNEFGEFLPRHARPCNVVAFSPGQPQCLAMGLDKVRNDHCLLVWDVERQIGGAGSSVPSGTRPLQQYGSSEAITSLAWLPKHAGLLGAGMGLKWIRIYDTRQGTTGNPSVVISTKAVYGIDVDPFHDYRFASFTEEGVIKLWDMRKTSDPVMSLDIEGANNGLARIAFHPHRRGYLASLTKDEDFIRIWSIEEGPPVIPSTDTGPRYPADVIGDIQAATSVAGSMMNAVFGGAESLSTSVASVSASAFATRSDWEAPILWRTRQCKASGNPIASFVWIPTSSSMTLLSVTRANTIETMVASEPSPFGWSADGRFACGHDHSLTVQKPALISDDISSTMRHRVRAGYGMDATMNRTIIQNEHALNSAWIWVERMLELATAGKTQIGGSDVAFEGLIHIAMASTTQRTVLLSQSTSAPKEEVSPTAAMAYTAALNNTTTFIPIGRQYPGAPRPSVVNVVSPNPSETSNGGHQQASSIAAVLVPPLTAGRKLALKIVGWDSDADTLDGAMNEMFEQKQHEKAAAWAVFHGDTRQAVRALSMSDRQENKVIATALAGFPPRWMTYSTARSPGGSLPAASLQMSLWQDLGKDIAHPYLRALFLFVGSGGSFMVVLEDEQLPLMDRLAIGLRFLSDGDLQLFLEDRIRAVVDAGDLEGLILTGCSAPAFTTLLQTYLDRTADIQTVALLTSFAPLKCFQDVPDARMGVRAASRSNEWIESYRTLLDRWQQFHARCRFDIDRRKMAKQHISGYAFRSTAPFTFTSRMSATNPSPSVMTGSGAVVNPGNTGDGDVVAIEQEYHSGLVVPPQVYVRCNFCNQAIAHNSLLIPGVGLVGKSTANPFHVASPRFRPSVQNSETGMSGGGGGGTGSGYSTPRGSLGPTGMGSSAASPTVVTVPSGQRTKPTACPSCRKPLPRCSLCLLHMGMPVDGILNISSTAGDASTGIGSAQSMLRSGDSTSNVLGRVEADTTRKRGPSGTDLWFTWCQTCRHGGHAIHMEQWFARNEVCPVSDCTCKCKLLK